eukprot:gene1046-998_t
MPSKSTSKIHAKGNQTSFKSRKKLSLTQSKRKARSRTTRAELRQWFLTWAETDWEKLDSTIVMHVQHVLRAVRLLDYWPGNEQKRFNENHESDYTSTNNAKYEDRGPDQNLPNNLRLARIRLYDQMDERHLRITNATDWIEADRKKWLAQAESNGQDIRTGSDLYLCAHVYRTRFIFFRAREHERVHSNQQPKFPTHNTVCNHPASCSSLE